MKKLLSAILAAVMLAGTFTVGMSAQTFVDDETFIVGNADSSEDGKVNGQDVFLVKSYLVGNAYAVNTVDTQAADLNADGIVNASDVFHYRCLLSGKTAPSDYENGRQIYRLTIGGQDISEYSLVVPEGYTKKKNAFYAAELMKSYIAEATGVELSILNDGTVPEKAIVFHDVPLSSELGQELGTEGYKYSVTNGVLNIYGTYRGNMYAVYEILEKYLGYRFYDSEYTYIYKQRRVDISEGTDTGFVPKMKFRYCGGNVKKGPEIYYIASRQNGTQLYSKSEERYGLQYGPQFINAHSYGYYWRMGTGKLPEDDGEMDDGERYKAKYDSGEQKKESSWQPCASDNKVYDTLFEGLVGTLRMIEGWGSSGYAFTTTAKHLVEEGQKTMSFSICDNEDYCSCLICNRTAKGRKNPDGSWRERPEGYSGLYTKLANRAAVDIQQYYPGMRIHTILYNHDIPATVRPDKNLIVFYCGLGCNNHYINSGECTNFGQLKKENNIIVAESLKAWGEMCAETGAEMWFWYYGITYHYYLVSLPCIFNIYYDYKFLYEECNVRGIYYEGGSSDYNFENVKTYMSTKMEWEPDMSYEQYIAYLKEYLYMYYGDGYEKIFEFIDMENTAGDLCGTCFVSNFDRPGDMYSYSYIDENYEYMRQLLCDALDMAKRAEQQERIKVLLICFDFLGLSSSYDRMYTNGDAALRTVYEQRYTDMYNGIKDRDMELFSNPQYSLPETIDFTVNPMTQIYQYGSRRPGVTP